MANDKVLVTGGAGFIGSHLAEALLASGSSVVVLDNLSSGKKENMTRCMEHADRFCFVQGCVTDVKAVSQAICGVSVVFHQAAVGSVPRSIEDPYTSHCVNATGTLQLLMAAHKAGVKRFVNAASSSAYGDTPILPKTESMAANPFSPYAATKLVQEHYCRAFSVSYGMETISLRYFNVFGPRQDPNSQYAGVVPKFFRCALCKESPIIYGDGEQTRDFTFVQDVVSANLKAAQKSDVKGEVFNIAGGQRTSISELAKIIYNLVGCKCSPTYVALRPGDILHSLADINQAKRVLNWQPMVSLQEGLTQCLTWYSKIFGV